MSAPSTPRSGSEEEFEDHHDDPWRAALLRDNSFSRETAACTVDDPANLKASFRKVSKGKAGCDNHASDERAQIGERQLTSENWVPLLEAPAVLVDGTPPYKVIDVTREWLYELKYSRKELIGKTLAVVQGPRTEKHIVAHLMAKVRQRQLIHVRLTNYNGRGDIFINDLTVEPVLVDGRPCFLTTSNILAAPPKPPKHERFKKIDRRPSRLNRVRSFGSTCSIDEQNVSPKVEERILPRDAWAPLRAPPVVLLEAAPPHIVVDATDAWLKACAQEKYEVVGRPLPRFKGVPNEEHLEYHLMDSLLMRRKVKVKMHHLAADGGLLRSTMQVEPVLVDDTPMILLLSTTKLAEDNGRVNVPKPPSRPQSAISKGRRAHLVTTGGRGVRPFSAGLPIRRRFENIKLYDSASTQPLKDKDEVLESGDCEQEQKGAPTDALSKAEVDSTTVGDDGVYEDSSQSPAASPSGRDAMSLTSALLANFALGPPATNVQQLQRRPQSAVTPQTQPQRSAVLVVLESPCTRPMRPKQEAEEAGWNETWASHRHDRLVEPQQKQRSHGLQEESRRPATAPATRRREVLKANAAQRVSPADAGANLANLYHDSCEELKIKRNSGVVKMLLNAAEGAGLGASLGKRANLANLMLGDRGIHGFLRILPRMQAIQFLGFTGNTLHDRGVQCIVEALQTHREALPGLCVVDLSYNPIGTRGAEALQGCLEELPNILVLGVESTQIGDMRRKRLAMLSHVNFTAAMPAAALEAWRLCEGSFRDKELLLQLGPTAAEMESREERCGESTAAFETLPPGIGPTARAVRPQSARLSGQWLQPALPVEKSRRPSPYSSPVAECPKLG
eukprot:TRINITY_DN28686_c0_g2_i1.p1 TRINITY_DN28686_c0_g2~~TRINITY_DN28686_c0_g2_i1.p1  ORF type:complete len:846 (-),score=134.66 TRINITY_DN28686_c0_g2_i1:67-2604(-)